MDHIPELSQVITVNGVFKIGHLPRIINYIVFKNKDMTILHILAVNCRRLSMNRKMVNGNCSVDNALLYSI